jgi:hypothetical protein
MGMTVSGEKGDSVFPRGFDEDETCSLQLTASKTSGLGHAAFRTRSAAAPISAGPSWRRTAAAAPARSSWLPPRAPAPTATRW